MFSYSIIKDPDFIIDNNIIDNIFKIVSKIVSKEQNWCINIVFLDDDSIKNLNNNYRNIDSNTDVLSFHYYDDFWNLNNDDIAWEIIMSESKIISQWIDEKHWSEHEFYILLIHSVLHILWYDHEDENDYKIMNDLEKEIYISLFWKNRKKE